MGLLMTGEDDVVILEVATSFLGHCLGPQSRSKRCRRVKTWTLCLNTRKRESLGKKLEDEKRM